MSKHVLLAQRFSFFYLQLVSSAGFLSLPSFVLKGQETIIDQIYRKIDADPWHFIWNYIARYIIDSISKICFFCFFKYAYRQISDSSRPFVRNKIVDCSDVVGTSPVGAAQSTFSFSTWHQALIDCSKTTTIRDVNHIKYVFWCGLY